MNNLVPQPQADSDRQLIGLWLHGRSPHTVRAYIADIDGFMRQYARPLTALRLTDLQDYASGLVGSQAKIARALSAIKSLIAFGHRLGYLAYDVGAPLRLPSVRDHLSERILTPEEIRAMIALEPALRNRAIMLLLYSGGLRGSELCGLNWGNIADSNGEAYLNIFGKGGKSRTVLISEGFWKRIKPNGNGVHNPSEPVFRSASGNRLDPSSILRVVRAAAVRAGIDRPVSPHWLRHAHATHALENGAPIHIIQATLGHSSVATTGRYLHARPADSSGKYLKA